MPVKFGDSSSNASPDIHQQSRRICGIFDRFFVNFDNCQLEVVSDVISVMVDQEVGMDVFVNFGDSMLKPSDASFWPFFERP